MEDLVNFILFFLEAVFWYWVISLCVAVWRAHHQAAGEHISQLTEKITQLVHKIQEEKHGNCYYWFDRDDNQFLAQGATLEDIVLHLKSRFPDHIFFLTSNDQHYYLCQKTNWEVRSVDIKN